MQQNIIPGYQALKDKYEGEYTTLSKKHNWVTVLRLLLSVFIIACIYTYIKAQDPLFIYLSLAAALAFFILMKSNRKITWQKSFLKNLIRINQEEINYLNKGDLPFDNGLIYKDDTHGYTTNLDIFG